MKDSEGASRDDERRPASPRSDGPEDVLLDVPVLTVDEIQLEVERLKARVSLNADVLSLLKLHVGVDAEIGKVNLTIKGVDVQALLKVRLDNVKLIIDRVLATIDANPEIVRSITRPVGTTLEQTAVGARGALERTGRGVGSALQETGRGAGSALEETGRGGRQALAQGATAGSRVLDETGHAGREALEETGRAGREMIDETGNAGRETAERDSRDRDEYGREVRRAGQPGRRGERDDGEPQTASSADRSERYREPLQDRPPRRR